MSSSSATRSRRWARGTPAARSGISMLRAADSHGNSADSWNISATCRPPADTSPAVGWSRPATRFSRVLLPHPDAPIRRDELARRDGQRDPVQGQQGALAPAEALGHLADLDGRAGRGIRIGAG